MIEQGPSPVTGPREINPCPSCGGTSGVRVQRRIPGGAGVVVLGVPDGLGDRGREPAPVLDHLTATVEPAAVHSMLRQVIALADEAPALPDDQLRARLVDLARTARPGCRRG
jgi:hypothetical protein